MFSTPMLAPRIWILVFGKTCGTRRSPVPTMICMRFCRISETPIAVISGATRGAWRRGR